MKNLILTGLALFIMLCSTAQTISDHIHVDQFGYQAASPKVIVLSNPLSGFNSNLSYTPASNLEVIDAQTQSTVLNVSPQIWNNGSTHDQSGDQGWWLDISTLQTEGTYYILDPASNQRSPKFVVSDNPYEKALYHTGRMFFYNRCNAPKSAPYAESKWIDTDNFSQDLQAADINDPTNTTRFRDVSGGWFDAGDYNKYVTFTHETLHNLLAAFEGNPTAFVENWNIPESGNGIPDLLDEIKWELEWLEKMQNSDGSVHIKAGSKNYSENTASPPSQNTDPRYYGPTCTSASIVLAGVFAHASIVFKEIPALNNYANTLLQKAMLSYQYAMPFYTNNSLETDCDDGSIVAGDADMTTEVQTNILIEAAMYLAEATENQTYHTFIQNEYQNHSLISSAYFGVYELTSLDALLRYKGLSATDPSIVTTIDNLINTTVGNDWENIFGWNELDLYRAFMPSYSYHWGSNQAKAKLGATNLLLSRYNVLNDSLNFRTKAKEQLHYFHGVNPMGMVYLTNMYEAGAERCVNELYHAWFADGSSYDHALNSPNGPAPGFLVGGPNANYTYADNTPPFGQPQQKSYLDFNTSWPQNSWEITEPAIYYQAVYLRLLSAFVTSAKDTTVNIDRTLAKESPSFSISPNPTKDLVILKSLRGERIEKIEVYDLTGKKMRFERIRNTLNISSLPSGMYVVHIIDSKQKVELYRIIKK